MAFSLLILTPDKHTTHGTFSKNWGSRMHTGTLDKCPAAPGWSDRGSKPGKHTGFPCSPHGIQVSLTTQGLAMCSSKWFKIITRLFWWNLKRLKCTQFGRLARAAELPEDMSQPSVAPLHTSLCPPRCLQKSPGLTGKYRTKTTAALASDSCSWCLGWGRGRGSYFVWKCFAVRYGVFPPN